MDNQNRAETANHLKTQHYPILFIISTPRCGSTALMRALDETAIFRVFHEPFVQPWTQREIPPEDTKDWFGENSNFEAVEETILAAAQQQPVLIKDMCFAVADWLENQSKLRAMPNVVFLLLVREPYSQLVSLVGRLATLGWPNDKFPIVNDYQRLESLYTALAVSKRHVLVASSEELFASSDLLDSVLQSLGFSRRVPQNWAAKSLDFDGAEWGESKNLENFRRWHGVALNSTKLEALPLYIQDWSQFENKKWAQATVEANMQAYKRLIGFRLSNPPL